jgi:hypothetical protein
MPSPGLSGLSRTSHPLRSAASCLTLWGLAHMFRGCTYTLAYNRNEGNRVFEASMSAAQPAAMVTPSARQVREVDAPRRSRKRTLTKVNRGSILGKRIDELKALFIAALNVGELSPLLRLKIDEAAQLKALAELARGDFMRGDRHASLDDIIRAERRGEQAVRALGIGERKSRQPTPASVAATSAPDLTQLSDAQLDRLGALLMGEAKGSDAEALRMDTEARRARAAEEPRT